MPWKGQYHDMSAAEAQTYAKDFMRRHALSYEQIAKLVCSAEATAYGSINTPGRRPSKLAVRVMRHIDGLDDLADVLAAVQAAQ